MKLKINHILLVFIAIISGCMPEPIDTEIASAPSRLVISSHMFPDEFLLITVSRSFSGLTKGTEDDSTQDISQGTLHNMLVKEAIVTVSYEDVLDTLEAIDSLPGLYFSDRIIQKLNVPYYLNVFDPLTGQSVSASSYVTPQVNLDSVSIRIVQEDSTVYLRYNFYDPEEVNKYVLNVFRVPVPLDETAPKKIATSFYSGTKSNLTKLLQDGAFKNTDYSEEIKLRMFRPGDTVGVMFSNISEEYYKYLLASYRSQNSITALLTSEPINYPSNIKNGYGIFSMRSPYLKVMILE